MIYTSQSLINGYISAQNLINLTDDNGTGSLDFSVLNAAMTTASNVVDGMLSATYQVPFTGTFPTLVVQAATIFTCEALFDRRLVPGENNIFRSRADGFRKQLEQIAQNRGGLDSGTLAVVAAGYVEWTPSLVNSSTA